MVCRRTTRGFRQWQNRGDDGRGQMTTLYRAPKKISERRGGMRHGQTAGAVTGPKKTKASEGRQKKIGA